MKKLISIATILFLGIIVFAFKGEEYRTLEIGEKAPMIEHKMTSTTGKEISLDDVKKENGTLVIFSCNTCPFVIAWEDRYPVLADLAARKKVGFILVNSNEAKRDGDDSMEEMKAHASEKGYESVNYVADEDSKLANAFGGKTTPHVFLFNKDWELVYEGAIDDNYKSAGEVQQNYLENALKNLEAGRTIAPSNTKAIGCSIKRVKS